MTQVLIVFQDGIEKSIPRDRRLSCDDKQWYPRDFILWTSGRIFYRILIFLKAYHVWYHLTFRLL